MPASRKVDPVQQFPGQRAGAGALAASAMVPIFVYTHIMPPPGSGLRYVVLRYMFTRV